MNEEIFEVQTEAAFCYFGPLITEKLNQTENRYRKATCKRGKVESCVVVVVIATVDISALGNQELGNLNTPSMFYKGWLIRDAFLELVNFGRILRDVHYRVTKVLGDTYFVDLKTRFAP